jgi:hypothetical protein
MKHDSVVTLKGAGIAAVSGRPGGDLFFVWILLALGASAAFLLVLAARGLWRFRHAGRVQQEDAP